jgi:hypothetical protein
MAISTLAVAGISLDAAGLYRQTASSPDNVFIFSDGSTNWEIIDKKGAYFARLGGIIPTAGDVTSALNTILADIRVKEVVFDDGDITINGTLTVPSGKILTFTNNGRLIGSGTISGGIINADFQSNILATTLTVNPIGVAGKYFSVKWFGAVGNGIADDHASIQTTINTIIRNRQYIKSIFLPSGSYKIDYPLIMYNWNGSNYSFFDLDFIGESSFWEESSAGTKIITNFSNQFAIGVQAGKGVRIENLYIIGNYTYDFTTTQAFYASTFEGYTSTTPCRDSQFSPYAAIVIDPFSNSASNIPSDGGYPATDGFGNNLSTYYRGTGGVTGSTGIAVTDCFLSGFTVGLITSPNGFTLNAELIYVNKLQISNCKSGIAGCQAQEKMNRVNFLGCWGECHTLLRFNTYGASGTNGEVGHWVIENVNIAGRVNQLISRTESGFFPMNISKVYAETLGKIGFTSFSMGTTISDSVFDFARPDLETKQYFLSLATGVCVFKNVSMRYYGLFIPIPMDGRMVLTECKTDVPFLMPDEYLTSGQRYLGTSIQDNINVKGWSTLNSTYPQCVLPSFAYYYYADGKTIVQTVDSATSGLKISFDPQYAIPYSYLTDKFTTKNVTVNRVNTNNVLTATITDAEASWIAVNSVVAFLNSSTLKTFGYGIVTALTDTGSDSNSMTISYIPTSVVDGVNYDLCVYRELQFFTFMGDITSGSNQITNVVIDMGSPTDFVGGNNVFMQDVTSATFGDRTTFLLTNWDSVTKTLTANKNFNVTKTGVYFSNNGYVKNISSMNTATNIFSNVYFKSAVLQKGGLITDSVGGEPLTYVVTKTGYIDASSIPDSRQAEWQLLVETTTTTTSTTTTTTTEAPTTTSTTTTTTTSV